MSEVPVRLLVISARVPEGAYCTGCDFCGAMTEELDTIPREGQYQVMGHVCCLPIEGCNGEEPEWEPGTDVPLRLPACRERDGWVAYPTRSGVNELVEAAKAVGKATIARDAAWPRNPELALPSIQWNAYMEAGERCRDAETALILAARKVAGEAGYE